MLKCFIGFKWPSVIDLSTLSQFIMILVCYWITFVSTDVLAS